MSHKMFDNVVAECHESFDGHCCVFDDCPVFGKCYPDEYKKWKQAVEKEKSESIRNNIK